MAYCRWLTARIGSSFWIFALPNDAEWEKAARGPDEFDYGLGNTISDAEASTRKCIALDNAKQRKATALSEGRSGQVLAGNLRLTTAQVLSCRQ